MAKKGHAPGPVPPGNRPHVGPAAPLPELDETGDTTINGGGGAGFNEQDPDRRLGNYQTAGEHSFVQPGGKNDADHQVAVPRDQSGGK
jgi:hypothetical protein